MTQDREDSIGESAAHVGSGPQVPAMLKRILPAAVLVLGLAVFFALGLDEYASFEALAGNRRWLIDAVADHAILSALIFFLTYATMIAFSIPGGAVMSVAGGFLFGQWFGLLYNVSAATLGATILFIAAKWAIGDALRKRAGPWLQRMEEGFRKNAFSYLLALRLVPAFPFWAVNLAPALLGVRFSTYVFATFIGIIPGGFVFSTFGAGIGSILDAGGEISVSAILTPQIITALVGLAILALVPVVYRKFKARS